MKHRSWGENPSAWHPDARNVRYQVGSTAVMLYDVHRLPSRNNQHAGLSCLRICPLFGSPPAYHADRCSIIAGPTPAPTTSAPIAPGAYTVFFTYLLTDISIIRLFFRPGEVTMERHPNRRLNDTTMPGPLTRVQGVCKLSRSRTWQRWK